MKLKVREGGWVHRTLTEPTLSETDKFTAELSRFAYSPCDKPRHEYCARLTPLGILNGLFGLELVILPSSDSSPEDSTTPSA